MPFTNAWARQANLATHFFAVGHPSLTNYIEIIGGSNLSIRSDNPPNWHATTCQPNVVSGQPNLDGPTSSGPVCPIAGGGTDAATPAFDCSNEYTGGACGNNIDGVRSYKADPNIEARTIADQLVDAGRSFKDYQEDIPGDPDGVNYSNG